MTREEEIKERLENNDYMDPGKFLDQAPEDLRYLLARNEELQRRVESLKEIVEEYRWGLDVADAMSASINLEAEWESYETGHNSYNRGCELIAALDAADSEENSLDRHE